MADGIRIDELPVLGAVTDLSAFVGELPAGSGKFAGPAMRAYMRAGLSSTVRDSGATGNGATNDTAAIQAAANAVPVTGGILEFPPGRYLINATIRIKSRTAVVGYGATLVASAAWPVPPVVDPTTTTDWVMLANVNFAAASITDQYLHVEGLTFEYTALMAAYANLVPGGGAHAIRFRKAKHIVVRDCVFLSGEDGTAFLGCDNTLVEGCTALSMHNAAYDHWEGPTNAKVVNNTATLGTTGYGILFTATDTATTGANVADSFLCQGNTIIAEAGSAGSNFAAIWVNTLNAGAKAWRAQILDNRIFGSGQLGNGIKLSGDGGYHAVRGNLIRQTTGGPPIAVSDEFSVAPGYCDVDSNTIENCFTSVGNVAYIVNRGAGGRTRGNRVTNCLNTVGVVWAPGLYPTVTDNTHDGYPGAYNTTGATLPIVAAPEVNAGIYSFRTTIRLDSGGILPNGRVLLLTDTYGGNASLTAQVDNNLVLASTNGTGAVRAVFGLPMHSSVSPLTFYVPVVFTGGTTFGQITSTVGYLGDNNTYVSIKDTGGTAGLRWDVTATNAARLIATTAAGADRLIGSIQTRNDTAAWVYAVPVTFSGATTTAGLATFSGNVALANTSLGFFGTSPQTKPTVTGSQGANAALASLITSLAALGLITNSSTV